MHILSAILMLIGTLALIFGSYVTFAVGGSGEDVSGGPAFIGCAFALLGIVLICAGVALRVFA